MSSAFEIKSLRDQGRKLSIEGAIEISTPSWKCDSVAKEALQELISGFGLVVVHDSGVTPETFPSLALALGQLVPTPFLRQEPISGISVLDHNVQHSDFDRKRHLIFASGWHADMSYLERPPSISLLFCDVAPEVGGNTAFCDTRIAMKFLSEPLLKLLSGLTATHSSGPSYDEEEGIYKQKDIVGATLISSGRSSISSTHPVLVKSSIDGRLCLNLNPAYVTRLNELEEHESKAILKLVYDTMFDEEAVLRVSWRPATLVIWDNLRFVHRALNEGISGRRRLLRANLCGRR